VQGNLRTLLGGIMTARASFEEQFTRCSQMIQVQLAVHR
jgi:hypothetical protein